MTTSERRRAIVLALCRRKKETLGNFAFEFGVSKRTIETDIMCLSNNEPVYTVPGRGGGICIEALKKLFKKVNKGKPFLENKRSPKDYLAGYINNEGLKEINQEIREQLDQSDVVYEYEHNYIDDMIFVVTEFKQKRLDTDRVYLDMGDEKLSISQIPLLINNEHVSNTKSQSKFFYIYYKENENLNHNVLKKEVFKKIMKESLKKYLKKG